MPSWRGRRETGLVDARGLAAPDPRSRASDRIVVVGGGPETLALLRLASVRSDDLVLVAPGIDAATRRFVNTFAVEYREGSATEHDLAGATALVVSLGDMPRENALVQAARRCGVPVHVAGRPLVSDFTMLELVERRPASFAR